jgi:hypothetical protein
MQNNAREVEDFKRVWGAVPVIERLVYGAKLPKRLLAAQRETLVQIDRE